MNKEYIVFISWFAFLCYVIPLYIYISNIFYYLNINDLPQVFNYSILACAFLAFSIYTFINAYNKTTQTKKSSTLLKSLYNSPARLGYGLMVLNIIVILLISWTHGEPIYFQRLLGIAGYLCLTFKITIGVFLIIAFYIFSLIYAVKVSISDYIFAISKAGLILYFSTHAYQFIINHIK